VTWSARVPTILARNLGHAIDNGRSSPDGVGLTDVESPVSMRGISWPVGPVVGNAVLVANIIGEILAPIGFADTAEVEAEAEAAAAQALLLPVGVVSSPTSAGRNSGGNGSNGGDGGDGKGRSEILHGRVCSGGLERMLYVGEICCSCYLAGSSSFDVCENTSGSLLGYCRQLVKYGCFVSGDTESAIRDGYIASCTVEDETRDEYARKSC